MEWNEIVANLSAQIGQPLDFESATPIEGGDISAAFRLSCGAEQFFVKLNSVDRIAMFEQEAQMLKQLANSCPLRLPEPLATGDTGARAWTVLEFVQFGNARTLPAVALGEGLAQLHQQCEKQYGWMADGYLGQSRQLNERSDNWCEFWRSQRLGFQLRLAKRNGLPPHTTARLELLSDHLDGLLGGYNPAAALLHGDLWHGNCGVDETGKPVIFDPASYFGDPEADLAMTEVFGGFPESFYQAYWQVHPRAAEYEVRSQLYQLYHVLNHFNLFGGLYANRADTMVGALLAHLGH
jgi:fructosamine-3-kinase